MEPTAFMRDPGFDYPISFWNDALSSMSRTEVSDRQHGARDVAAIAKHGGFRE
jgi:hypothetical protein